MSLFGPLLVKAWVCGASYMRYTQKSFLPKTTFLQQAKISKSSVITWKCACASALCVPPGGLATLWDAGGLLLQAQLLFTDCPLPSASHSLPSPTLRWDSPSGTCWGRAIPALPEFSEFKIISSHLLHSPQERLCASSSPFHPAALQGLPPLFTEN